MTQIKGRFHFENAVFNFLFYDMSYMIRPELLPWE